MKKLMIIALLTAFLAPLALGGCTSTPNSDSSYEKRKSDYESKRREGSGGY